MFRDFLVARGRPGRRLRRLAVRRARRRPRPQRTAAADVLRRRRCSCSARSSTSSTRDNLLNPGVLVDPRPLDADLRVPRAGLAPGPGVGLPRRRRRLHPGGAPLHRRRQVPGRQRRDRRRDVPVVPGDPGGEGLHPRAAPGCCRRWSTARPSPVAGDPRRCTRRSTCACRARAAPRTARPASTWPPTRPRCCTRATGAGCARASHYALGWLPRWAATGGADAARWSTRLRGVRGSARLAMSLAGVDRPAHACRRSRRKTFRSLVRRPNTAACAGDPVLLFVDSFTNYFTPEVGVADGAGAARPPVTAPQLTGQAAVLRADLDLDRPARRGPQDPRPHRGRAVDASHLPLGDADRRAGTVVHRGAALRRRRTAARRSAARRAGVAAKHPHARRAARRRAAGARPISTARSVVAQPHCHHHAVMGWSADAALLASAGADGDSGSAAAAGWPATSASRRGHYEVSVAVAEQQLLPGGRGRTPRRP